MNDHYYSVLILFLMLVLAGNIPVGLLRVRFEKFSRPWARCIYIPVLANIIIRRFAGLTYKTIPLVILAVIAGQLIGSKLHASKIRVEG